MDDAVGLLLRQAAAAVVIPRFRNLRAHEVEEKGSPDDLVTIADRESEERLRDGLLALDPGASVVGEEAAAADPSLLVGIGRGRHWLIDPIDGTGNFAAGRTPFGLMVALVEDGEPVAGWLLDPVGDRLCHARRGGGAFMGGHRVRSRPTGAAPPVAALSQLFPAAERTALATRADVAFIAVEAPRCAAEQYPRLGLGGTDAALFRCTLPWDHAAGALWLAEAGGRVARLDNSPYRVGDEREGLLAAATPELWDRAARAFGFA